MKKESNLAKKIFSLLRVRNYPRYIVLSSEPKHISNKEKNVKRGFFRKKQMKNYSEEKYYQRNLVESAMRFKSKYGGAVRTKGLRAIQAEIYLRMIASNLSLKV